MTVRLVRLCLVAAVLCVSLGNTRSVEAAPNALSSGEKEIQQIQNGLLPAAFVSGTAVQPMRLRDRMFVYHATGVSVAVVHRGAIAWSEGFGVTHLTGPPVTPDTLFQAASISKPLTAVVALRLAHVGKIDLDADVNEYLKSWKLPRNQFTRGRKVTIRELLTHTAGTNVPGFPGYPASGPVPSLPQVLNGILPANTPPIRVTTTPGTIWRYSGGGYAIIQQVLVDVTGESFPDLMEEEVLSPIGMTHSTFAQPLPQELSPSSATPYLGSGEEVPGGAHVYPEMAAAGLWTTASDLARFLIAVQNALKGRRGAILPRYLAEQLVATRLGKRGTIFGVRGSLANPYFAHSGENAGFSGYVVGYEESGEGAVVLTNTDRGFDLAEEVMRAVAKAYHWPDFHPMGHALARVSPDVLERYSGTYRLSPQSLLYVNPQGNDLLIEVAGQEPWTMLPDSRTHFFAPEVNIEISFHQDRTGQIYEAVLRQYGDDTVAKKIRSRVSCERKFHRLE